MTTLELPSCPRHPDGTHVWAQWVDLFGAEHETVCALCDASRSALETEARRLAARGVQQGLFA